MLYVVMLGICSVAYAIGWLLDPHWIVGFLALAFIGLTVDGIIRELRQQKSDIHR